MDEVASQDVVGDRAAPALRAVNVADYEQLAAAALEPGPLGYFAGGAADERTLRENVEAWSRRACDRACSST